MKETTKRPPRDSNDRLNCQIPGCRATIGAWSGFQEIDKLRKHMEKVHMARLTMTEALELRASWESRTVAP